MKRERLWRDIVGILVVKAIGLAALYALFFAPSEQPIMTTQRVAQHVVVLPSPSPAARTFGGEQ
jgi:hypothetical protein